MAYRGKKYPPSPVDTVALKRRQAEDVDRIIDRETHPDNPMVSVDEGVDHYDRGVLRARGDTLDQARAGKIPATDTPTLRDRVERRKRGHQDAAASARTQMAQIDEEARSDRPAGPGDEINHIRNRTRRQDKLAGAYAQHTSDANAADADLEGLGTQQGKARKIVSNKDRSRKAATDLVKSLHPRSNR